MNVYVLLVSDGLHEPHDYVGTCASFQAADQLATEHIRTRVGGAVTLRWRSVRFWINRETEGAHKWIADHAGRGGVQMSALIVEDVVRS